MAVHDLLKGREYNQNKAVEGFDEVNNSRTPRAVHQSGYADVLLRPTMVGILRCGKMLPPQLNLVIEIEFADATTALSGAAVTAAALASGLQASKADASALTAYALQSAVDTSSEVDSKIATALLDAVTAAALLGKADASALASLLSTVDAPLEVDTKIANALLGLATEAFVAAQLASRDASVTALQGAKADATLLASYATNAALSASETTLQSALDAIPPLSAALANGDDTLSITADCYSTAGTDAAITAALLAYYTSSQVDTLLGDYPGTAQDAETAGAITAALLAYYTAAQVDALLGDYRTASGRARASRRATGRGRGAPPCSLCAARTGPSRPSCARTEPSPSGRAPPRESRSPRGADNSPPRSRTPSSAQRGTCRAAISALRRFLLAGRPSHRGRWAWVATLRLTRSS